MPCATSRLRPLDVCMAANLYCPRGSRCTTNPTQRLHSTHTPSKTMMLSAMLRQPSLVVHEQTDAGNVRAGVEPIASVDDRLERSAAGEQRRRQRQKQKLGTRERPDDAIGLRRQREPENDRPEHFF